MQSPTQFPCGKSDSSHRFGDACSIKTSDASEDSDAEPNGFPQEDSELIDTVFLAIQCIWGPLYFPDAFIRNEGSAFAMLPTEGTDLFEDASVDIMKWHHEKEKSSAVLILHGGVTCTSLLSTRL